MTFANVIIMLSGVGMLLYGMKMMSGGLETIAGDSLKGILRKATSNRFLAVLVGIVSTIAINSSTATTIMAVGFVNSGLLTLTQSIGIIMGANVGTTFSAQMLALVGANIRLDTVAASFILVGAVMYVFFKNSKIKNIGYVVLGLGILFLGVTTMSDGVRPLRGSEGFREFLISFENPVLALLTGFIVTAILQSSTATTTMLVALLLEYCPDTGMPIFDIPFRTTAFILLGVNIGTSLTTVIASIPASRESKRAALFHIMYDIIGSIAFGSLILVFPGILNLFTSSWAEPATQAAMFHTIYNVSTLLLLLPFIKYIATLMQKIIPIVVEKAGVMYEQKLMYLDNQTKTTPTLSVVNAHLEVCRMGKIANENLSLALEAFFEKSSDKAVKIFENEKIVDYLHQNISAKLADITNMPLSAGDAKKIGDMFVILADIEQIGDHAEDIAGYVLSVNENNLKFSDAAIEELKVMSKQTVTLMNMALDAYERNDKSQIQQIKELEEEIDNISSKFAKNHFKRLKAKECKPKSGVVFMDIINDLEKSADNAEKIALSMNT